MKATFEAGLNVPDDISIMGFDGNQLGALSNTSFNYCKKTYY